MRYPFPRLARLAAPLLAVGILAGTSSATWSIVLVNRATGEVAVVAATCLPGTNIKKIVPVIWVGVGAAAAQSAGDATGANRVIIRDGLFNHDTPQQILDELRFGAGTAPNQRQYGIASFDGPPVTFTGGQAGVAKIGVVGEVGGLSYAIQGNVLAGDEVVYATELALLSTEGDIGTRMIAAMEAGRDFGGDGRCSCDNASPDSCGSPPLDFEKSAHVISFQVARIGDTNGGCNSGGCAKGTYYTNLKFIGNFANPDPITKIAQTYNGWRLDRAGVPDHILSKVVPSAESLPADGVTQMDVTIELIDLEGVPLTEGGAVVEVSSTGGPEGVALVEIGSVVDHGDGTYSFTVTVGEVPGDAELVITADDGFKIVTLYPPLSVRVDPPLPLHAGFDEVHASTGVTMPFVITEPTASDGYYMIIGSASGTFPGVDLEGMLVQLNPDALTVRTIRAAGGGLLPGTVGFLDAAGRAEGAFVAPPGLMNTVIGMRLDWVAVTYDGSVGVTNPVGFDVVF